jgi:hypothetical protein
LRVAAMAADESSLMGSLRDYGRGYAVAGIFGISPTLSTCKSASTSDAGGDSLSLAATLYAVQVRSVVRLCQ